MRTIYRPNRADEKTTPKKSAMSKPEIETARTFAGQADRQSDGCWLWKGAHSGNGYGFIWIAGREELVHRYAYELLVGPIPPGLVIDHLCRNTGCCNPDHLEAVQQSDNLRRAERKRNA